MTYLQSKEQSSHAPSEEMRGVKYDANLQANINLIAEGRVTHTHTHTHTRAYTHTHTLIICIFKIRHKKNSNNYGKKDVVAESN